MSDKIKPLKEHTLEASREAYKGVYGDVGRFITMKLKWRGIHSLICHRLGDRLHGASLLDVGCGYGRFCFLAARTAKRVVGMDMMPEAIEVARIINESLGNDNVEFVVSDAETYAAKGETFDIATFGGILEHLTDPEPVMRSIRGMVRPGGLLVINSPAEANFRGTVSTLLWKLFHFPMSLTDVRVVTKGYMESLAGKCGLRIVDTVGSVYSRGWGAMASKDLKQRISAVLEDVKEEVRGMQIDKEAFDDWVEERACEGAELLADWMERGILKPVPDRPDFEPNEEFLQEHGLPAPEIRAFLRPDFSLEPYYSDVPPYNTMGGQTIYFLERVD